jgi:alanine dehydrogenase
MTIMVITEAMVGKHMTIASAIAAVETAYRLFDEGTAKLFPVSGGSGSPENSRFAVKSGRIPSLNLIGLKIGTYWPANPARGLDAHGSTTLLLDDDTGFPKAVIEATLLTALRTAGADGVAIRHLSQPDARKLAVVGAGHQAYYDIVAACSVRSIDEIRIWSRRPEQAEALAERIQKELGVRAGYCDLETAIRSSEIILTITSSHQPLFPADWVCPGTHISAMGTDSLGKQELDPALLEQAQLFADVAEQAVTIGEFQPRENGAGISPDRITPIGAVVRSRLPGRRDPAAVTVFDSSGMAVQDLAISHELLSIVQGQL